MGVRVQTEDFDVAREIALLRGSDARVGAVASFVGLAARRKRCRDRRYADARTLSGDDRKALTASSKKPGGAGRSGDAVVIHRVGELAPTDQIVLVAVSSAHRGDAFAACEFIIDYLKTQAPFWKKELTPDGERWVEARDSDKEAADR
jgi:molybdopterin synthase catalytic subunit